MPYKFDLTSSTTSIGASDTVSISGYDISEFDSDSRGAGRIADWSDLSSMNQSEYDTFLAELGITGDDTLFVSWNASPYNGNSYYWNDGTRSRPFWARMTPSNPGGWHETNLITGELYGFMADNIVLGSWPANLKTLVYFPNAGAAGDPHIKPIFGEPYTI